MKNNEVRVIYKESQTGGEIYKGYENLDWPSYEDTYIDWEIVNLTKNDKDKLWSYELVTCDFDIKDSDYVYVVYVRYSTGNSFGSTSGCGHIVGVYKTLEEADKIYNQILNHEFSGYTPWIGYFENLESVDYQQFKVN